MDQGDRAIQPRSNSIPSFTEQDVRDYLSHRVPLGRRVRQLSQPTITQIVFTTIGDLDRACGDDFFGRTYGSDRPICYVEVRGEFLIIPPGPGTIPSSTRSIVFDARTGNHLFSGGTPADLKWS